MTEIIVTFGAPLGLIILAMVTGSILERRHFRSIEERERVYGTMPMLNVKTFPTDRPVADCRMVCGCVVVSLDHFKRFLAGLRNIFGGEVRSYCSLMDRGRREAILRMKEEFPDADLIVNMRVETSSISNSTRQGKQQNIGCTEVIAYGTAVKYQA